MCIKFKGKFLLGFLLAPLVAPIVFTVIILIVAKYSGLGVDTKCSLGNIWYCLDGFIIVFCLGAPIAYIVAILLGLPAYYFFYRKKWINSFNVIIGSGIVAILPLLIAYIPALLQNNGEEMGTIVFLTFLLIFICGISVGIVFWLITHKETEDTQIN